MQSRIGLTMLDSSATRPLHVWTFEGRDTILLGRSTDNDVVVAHPSVSRAHACLSLEPEGWQLISVSQQGLYCTDRKVMSIRLVDGVVFRLGAAGPAFRFDTDGDEEAHFATDTANIVGGFTPDLAIDAAQVERQVTEVVEDPFFQELQQRIARLRQQPGTKTSH